MKNLKLLCVLFVIFLLNTVLWSQGKIIGHVEDKETGQPLPGANVIVSGTYLGAATNQNGDYVIVNVPVGVYIIEVSYVGYTKTKKTGVIVSQGRITKVNFQLERAVIEGATVTVVAERDILHKEVTGSQNVIMADRIVETAGVTTLHDFLAKQAGITDERFLEIRGGNPQETGTIINGFAFVNTRVGKTESFIPTSSIEQVSVQSSGMSAEYGEFRSGIIEVTTKTGYSDRYHGTFSFKRNQPHMKRFGRSLYDPMNNALRPHLDPDIAFIGVEEAIKQGIITEYEAQQFVKYNSFRGFPFYTGRRLPSTWKTSLLNMGLDFSAITAVDLYLYDAWMHQVFPDFDKLNRKIEELDSMGIYVGEKVTDPKLIELFRKHANKEGRTWDYVFDGGFGGPVPIIGKNLGNMTFYLSNITARTAYVQPKELDSDYKTTTMLVLKSNISKKSNLKITSLYNYHKGMSPTHGGENEMPNLSFAQGLDFSSGTWNPHGLDRGDFMPEDNILLFSGQGWGGNYGPRLWWYVTDLQIWKQYNFMLGLKYTHTINERSFFDVQASYMRTKDHIHPKETRDETVLYRLGGVIPLTEAPYGRRILPLNTDSDTVDGFIFDQFHSVPGLEDRFDSKGGLLFDHSLTQQFRFKINYGNQINMMHFIKTGAEVFVMDLNNDRFGYWHDPGSAYEYMFKVRPVFAGAYIQDQISYEEMILNLGIRVDYFGEASGLKWPTGRLFDEKAFGINYAKPPTDWLEMLHAGKSVVWWKWDTLDNYYRRIGEKPLYQPVKSHLVFSPRLGVSFPLTSRTKFYFNYGHFRMLPPYSEMYMYVYRHGTAKGGLYHLGNPNLEPVRTIQYELGIDYNLMDMYLIHVAGYYKDVTGEVRPITYIPNYGNGFSFRTNQAYKGVQGAEIQITKQFGEILTGWAKLQYIYVTVGYSGREYVYEDPDFNNDPDKINYYRDPKRPYPVPQFSANITLRSPSKWGYIFGDWRFSFLPEWKRGEIFRYNPRGLDVNNEFRWPDIFLANMAISKTFDLKGAKATLTVDILNLFNTKIFTYKYAFAKGIGSETGPSQDFKNYMASLHLKDYKDSYYDPIRDEEKGEYLYPGYVYTKDITDPETGEIIHHKGEVVRGEDHIGDVRSSKKPHINNPNLDIFTFGNEPRSIWIGLRIDF